MASKDKILKPLCGSLINIQFKIRVINLAQNRIILLKKGIPCALAQGINLDHK